MSSAYTPESETVWIERRQASRRTDYYQSVLLELARTRFDSLEQALQRITAVDARTLGVGRVSVWLFNEDHTQIMCYDLYDRCEELHHQRAVLTVERYPRYFAALEENRVIAAHDARTDPNTADLGDYLDRFRIASMLDVPLRHEGRIFGVVCHEHTGAKKHWRLDEQCFAASIADLVASLFANDARHRAEERMRIAYDALETRVRERTAELARTNAHLQQEIMERKRAEAALRESEQRLETLVEYAPEAIMILDAETGRFIQTNENGVRLFGYPREVLIGMGPADPSPEIQPDGRPSSLVAREKIKEALSGRNPTFEWVHCNAAGELIWCEVHLVRLPWAGRQILRGNIIDITQRKRTEEAMKRSNALLKAQQEAALDGILVVDEHQRVVSYNHRFCELWRIPDRLMQSGKDQELLNFVLSQLAEPQRFLAKVEYLYRHPDETSRDEIHFKNGRVLDRYSGPVRSNAGDYYGRIWYFRDITERKRAEAERLRATVEAAFDCIISMDSQGNVMEFNPAAERCFGYQKAEVLGKPLADLIIPKRYREAHQQGLAHYREKRGGGSFLGQRIEIEAMRSDGTEFPVELAIDVAQSPQGDIFIGYVRDITERREAEAERARLEAQLRQAQKMEAIGHLTGGIAHDFNNILTGVMGYIVLAMERAERTGDAKLDKYLDRAYRSGLRARDLIQQMLTFSRGQRGEPRPLSLGPLIKESVKLLGSTLPSTIEIQLDLDAETPPAMLDPVQVEQVLMNLCINARDAMSGSGRLRISLRSIAHHDAVCASCHQTFTGSFVELAVWDTGPGIPPENVDRIFEPFFTTKEVGKGSGMGLATVHGIVHEYGGHITLHTEVGKGTEFRVLFRPLVAVPVGTTAVLPAIKAATTRKTALHGRVLVVDDDPVAGDFMEDLLGNLGLEVRLVRNPVEARDAFAQDPQCFDLAVLDQTMPRMTGLELAGQLQAMRPDLPMILYTGYSEDLSEEQISSAGIRALVRKPVDTDELYILIEALLSAPAH